MTDRSNVPETEKSSAGRNSRRAPRLVALVTDVGGPVLLHELLSELPGNFPLPIVVLQPVENVLLEANLKALGRTVPFSIQMLGNENSLAAGSVYVGLADHAYNLTDDGDELVVNAEQSLHSEFATEESLVRFGDALGDQLIVAFLMTRIESFKLKRLLGKMESSRAFMAVVHTSTEHSGLDSSSDLSLRNFDEMSSLAHAVVQSLQLSANNQVPQQIRR